ncbi:MAG: CocE/NonD family hydrolase [Clostridiales Family XIII bacterium]|jgi:putative CocE/NonD family hydrolase|nr:CocE/NonD family hydrolase [Clostridiales Family XIII bacterium]
MADHDRQVFRYYDFGVHIADFTVVRGSIFCKQRDAKTLAWGVYRPLNEVGDQFEPPRHLPVHDILSGINSKQLIEDENYVKLQEVSASIDGNRVNGWIWVQVEGTYPCDYIVVGDSIVGVVGCVEQGISNTLILQSYEALSPAVKYHSDPNLSTPQYGIEHTQTVLVPMKDGTRLSTDVILPAGLKEDGKVPVILIRTPYGKGNYKSLPSFAHYGYGVVLQDVRGREDSEGEWVPFMNEMHDGGDTVDWIASQPWCNGSIGMYGRSYLGMVQWLAAANGSPHLKTLISVVTSGIPVYDLPHRNGILGSLVFGWAFAMSEKRMNPSLMERDDWDDVLSIMPPQDIPDKALGRDVPWIRDWLTHEQYDDYWEQANWEVHEDKIDIPALYVSGWYDDTEGTPQTWAMNARNGRKNQKMIAGPWCHNVNTCRDIHGIPLGLNSIRYDFLYVFLRWFDRFLKEIDNGVAEEPPVEYFVMGQDQWAKSSRWPPAEVTEVAYYLASDGGANTRNGNGALVREQAKGQTPDTYTYDPLDPVPQVIYMTENECAVPADYAEIEDREDVLVYTTDVLEEDVVIAGAASVVLYCGSSAKDTDWVVRLTDVDETGASIRLGDGVCRAKYRHSFKEPALLTPGTVEEYTIKMTWVSKLFPVGHRIRLQVTSSAKNSIFPNHNTGNPFPSDTEIAVAKQTVYHNSEFPSRIILPVITLK